MPTLTDPNQVFALELSTASNVVWTLQQQQLVIGPQPVGSATNPQNFDYEGVASAAGISAIGVAGVPGFTLEATYVSIVNTSDGAVDVSYGKIIRGTTYYQVSPRFTLNAGWTAIFVKDSGWVVYNANGIEQGAGAQLNSLTFGDGTSQDTSAAASNINACMVYNSQGQAVNAATAIQCAFDTVIDQNTSPAYNGAPFWNPATPTFLTIPVAGYYQVSCGYSINPSNGPGQTYLQIFKKGYPGGDEVCFAQQTQEQNQTSDNQSLNASAIIACVAGDEIYFMIGNSGPDDLSVFGGISTCYLNVALLAGGG